MSNAATYDPSNEPYLGRQSVFHFDNMISAALAASAPIATYTRGGNLTRLQLAATEIVPHGFSLALSIRELVRQGYLLGAEVLVRPLLERAAVISYLCDHEHKIALWEAGWPYKSRPHLKDMMGSMAAESAADLTELTEVAARVVHEHNSLVHADPTGAYRHAAQIGGRLTFSPSKSLDEPERCDALCFEAMSWLIVLTARASAIFPAKDTPLSPNPDQ
jgi:hypothetical protein